MSSNVRWSAPLRTVMFVPGYAEHYLERATEADCDAVVLDLEDSVPDGFKAEARRLVHTFLSNRKFRARVFVRISALEAGVLQEDLEASLVRGGDGLMLTKVRDRQDIVEFDRIVTEAEVKLEVPRGHFRFLPLIETAFAVINAFDIAQASERVIALAFGGEDYLTDLDGLHKEHGTSLLMPRSMIAVAARAARIDALDTPYLAVENIDGFRREVEQARELGFSGQLILHPRQLDVARSAFTPSRAEIDDARAVIEAIEVSSRAGKAVAMLDGQLVGPPMLKRAHAVLEKAKRLGVEGVEGVKVVDVDGDS